MTGLEDVYDLLNWTIVAFMSIIIHELGHAFAGRRYGASPSIVLHGLGGLTFLPGGVFTRLQSILVSAAGPVFSLILAGFFVGGYFLAGTGAPHAIRSFIFYGLWINIGWTIFNLMPIQPLDGGQIFRDILGPSRYKITCWVGALVGVALALFALWAGMYFMAFFAGFLAWSNYKGSANIPGGIEK